jgi:NADH-quinone oxidoreductase subunit G
VLCSRCIRFCKEVAKDDVLGFTDRGSFTTISCYPGRQLDNNYSLNTVDICPVGALTSTDFRFQMRVWFLKQTNSIDTESSVGANTVVWSREGVIYRITPRRNDEVNDTWMADSGRLLYKQVRAENRLTVARIAGQVAAEAEAIKAAADLLKAGDAFIVASGRSTVEEQFLAKRLSELVKAPVSLVARIAQGDKLLVSADRNPNVRGALVTKLNAQLPKPQLTELGAQIDADHVRTILSLGEDLAEAGLTPAQLAKVKIVYLGTHANSTSDAAHVVIPALTAFEKDGTFINQQFRVQKFAAAVPGPAGVSGDLSALAQLIAAAGGITPPATVDAIWALLAAEVPALAGLSYRTLPETGRAIDHTEWAALSFPEGETLHYTPHRSA